MEEAPGRGGRLGLAAAGCGVAGVGAEEWTGGPGAAEEGGAGHRRTRRP